MVYEKGHQLHISMRENYDTAKQIMRDLVGFDVNYNTIDDFLVSIQLQCDDDTKLISRLGLSIFRLHEAIRLRLHGRLDDTEVIFREFARYLLFPDARSSIYFIRQSHYDFLLNDVSKTRLLLVHLEYVGIFLKRENE